MDPRTQNPVRTPSGDLLPALEALLAEAAPGLDAAAAARAVAELLAGRERAERDALEQELLSTTYAAAKEHALRRFEKGYVEALLRACGDNISAAARKAGMDRSNFKRVLRKHRKELGLASADEAGEGSAPGAAEVAVEAAAAAGEVAAPPDPRRLAG